jgi:hypothetical protein
VFKDNLLNFVSCLHFIIFALFRSCLRVHSELSSDRAKQNRKCQNLTFVVIIYRDHIYFLI